MDGSKRSSTQAYFTGLGREKRIVFSSPPAHELTAGRSIGAGSRAGPTFGSGPVRQRSSRRPRQSCRLRPARLAVVAAGFIPVSA